MLKCSELARIASDYIDGELDTRRNLSVKTHLMMCKHCRRYVHQFRLSSQASAQLAQPDDPDDGEINRLVEQLRG